MIFQRLSNVFSENAITRAERIYQQNTPEIPPCWQRIGRIVMWVAIPISLMMFGGFLIASITQRDPSPIAEVLNLWPKNLLTFFVFSYHLYLMFLTITLAANSIIREKEAQSWERFILSGVTARQIVYGKWWAIIRHQLPLYLLLGVLRAGVTAASVISFLSPFINHPSRYQSQVQIVPPINIFTVAVLGVALTLANLALSAACGVMGSAVSKSRTFAVVWGFAIQIVISLIPSLIAIFVSTRPNFYATGSFVHSIYVRAFSALFSLADNGLYFLSNLLSFQTYDSLELIISVAFIFAVYAFLIWVALWLAKSSVARSLVTPST